MAPSGVDGWDEPLVSRSALVYERVPMTRPDGSPVFDEDGQQIMVRRYSDTLLIALARAHCPEFRPTRRIEVTAR